MRTWIKIVLVATIIIVVAVVVYFIIGTEMAHTARYWIDKNGTKQYWFNNDVNNGIKNGTIKSNINGGP